MNPSETTRKKTELTSRRQKVSEMYLSGSYMSVIAESLGVDTATISRDLAELRKEWLDRSINHIDQKKAIELAKLDRLEVTYWEAWERSKQPFRSEITEGKGTKSEAAQMRKTVRTEERDGNPTFLEGVLKCITKRCEILGLDAPKKFQMLDVTKLSDEELLVIREGKNVSG